MNTPHKNYSEVKSKILENYNDAWVETRDKVLAKVWGDVWLQLVMEITQQVDSQVVPKIIDSTSNSLKS